MPRSRSTARERHGRLPHIHGSGVWQSITFRLADALTEEPGIDESTDIEAELDVGHGACVLADPRAAACVEAALRHGDPTRYRLVAWCVMPNHVHALIAAHGATKLATIVHSWKSYTANTINAAVGRSGPLWQRGYYDRFIRNAAHLHAAVTYIEANPVTAGLVKNAAEWPFSSATVSRNSNEPLT